MRLSWQHRPRSHGMYACKGADAAAVPQVVLRKESEWMSRQPKARETKARSRIDNFEELQNKARSGPKKDLAVDFGDVQMARQGRKILVCKVRARFCTFRSLCACRLLSLSMPACACLAPARTQHLGTLTNCVVAPRHAQHINGATLASIN
jgi:hypothetical protein